MATPTPTPPASPIALITASARTHNNGAGLATWLTARFAALAAARTSHHSLAPASALSSLPLPYGPVEDAVISQAILPGQTALTYADPAVRAWSAAVSATPAVVILTPQYNWGYPGQLKNLLDHLYHEWAGKPVVLVTYGGHGGSRCAEQLKVVLEGGLHMRVVGEVQIGLPREYIRGDMRVGADGERDKFLQTYEETVEVAFAKLLDAVQAAETQA